MKTLMVLLLVNLCFVGAGRAESRHRDYGYTKPNIGIEKGFSPTVIDKILGQPQIEWIRGYFYRDERFFYWKLSDKVWLYIAFWDYEERGKYVVGDFAYSDEPKLGLTTKRDNSTSGPHIFIKVIENWLPFKKELPQEYIKQITKDELNFIKKYM